MVDWKLKYWIPVFVAVLAAFGSIWGATYTWANKSRELDIRMVELSLSILSGKSEGAQTLQARRFALRSLRKFSGVELSETDLENWALSGIINFGNIPYTVGTSYGNWGGKGSEGGGEEGTYGGNGTGGVTTDGNDVGGENLIGPTDQN